MIITSEYHMVDDELVITIRVPSSYRCSAKRARHPISHLIDDEQFFGMLKDVIDMKLGLELERTRP